MSVAALYVHVPFCVSKCSYCDFCSRPTAHGDPLMNAYARSVAQMARRARQEGLLEAQRLGYVGGGTPTLLGADTLAQLLQGLAEGGVAELSFEANPESLTGRLLARARETGATRVSVGIQSLHNDELRALGRAHDAEQARKALEQAVASGLAVSADLMGAIPRQTPQSLGASVDGVLAAGVGHVSVYPLQVEKNTPFGRAVEAGTLALPDPDCEADAMELACQRLRQAGLERYEVASYARPGQACRHNLCYWNGSQYLGLGTSAASMLEVAAYERLRALAPGLPPAPAGASRARFSCLSSARDVAAAQGSWEPLRWEAEFLTAGEAAAEDLMLAARTTAGIGRELAARASAALGAHRVEQCLQGLERQGLLAQSGEGWAPTQRGWLLGNRVYGALWDLASADQA